MQSPWKNTTLLDLLVSRGIGRVVVATQDPNSMVAGRGLARLTEAGIEVISGCLAKKAEELNSKFFFAMTEDRPWITLKWAQSRDGFVDPDERAAEGRGGHLLTGAASARHTHALRATHDGILVGMRTWLVDRPKLSTRHVPGNSPKRFILTSGTSPKPEHAPTGQPNITLVVPNTQLREPVLDTWRNDGYAVLGIQGLFPSVVERLRANWVEPAWLKAEPRWQEASRPPTFGTRYV